MMKFPEGPQDERIKMDPKFDWKYTRDHLAQMSAFEAKKAGDYAKNHMQTYKYNWVSYRGEKFEYRTMKKGRHYKVIREAMLAKLDQTTGMKKLLMQTKGLELLPDHTQKKPTPPAWLYHQIWMDIRDGQ